MDFREAVSKIEERGNFNRFIEMKEVFEERLKKLKPHDYTQRGLCYYYLLVSYLKADLVHETDEALAYYQKMDRAFYKQGEYYQKRPKHFFLDEMDDFYHLMERCYSSLEFFYHKHDFRDSRTAAYIRKMNFRQHSFWVQRKYLRYFEYRFIHITSSYGTSLLGWLGTTLTFGISIGLLYWIHDQFVQEALQVIPPGKLSFDYIYFSLVTMLTVGYGDFLPLTVFAKSLAILESLTGFIMLGVFVGLIQKRI